MLNHKKLSLLIAAGLAVSLSAFPVFAEDAPAPPAGDAPAAKKPHMSLSERLDKVLKITDAQKPTVDPILNEADAQIGAIRKNKALSREDRKAQTLVIYEGLPDKLNPTLDAKQQVSLAKYVERMKNPPAPKPRPKPADDGDQPAPGQDG